MDSEIVFCIGCGCGEEESCWWIRLDRPLHLGVCNDCAEYVKAWDEGDRTFHAKMDPNVFEPITPKEDITTP